MICLKTYVPKPSIVYALRNGAHKQYEKAVSAHRKAVVFMSSPQKLCMFNCWADPVVHLLLPKSFMAQVRFELRPRYSVVPNYRLIDLTK